MFPLFLLLCAQTKGPDTYFSDEELGLGLNLKIKGIKDPKYSNCNSLAKRLHQLVDKPLRCGLALRLRKGLVVKERIFAPDIK